VSTSPSDRVAIPGSERTPLLGARPVGPVDPDEQLSVTVFLRQTEGGGAAESPGISTPVDRTEFAARHGADPADIAKVEAFAEQYGLAVTGTDVGSRRVFLTGNAAAFAAAFGVDLRQYEYPGGRYRGREGAVTVPASLTDVVTGVFGLDDRPQASPRSV
jgi:kumamolisin